MTWTWLRKENLKRKTESLLIAAQNNAIGTNYIKAKIDNSQQNSKGRLCGYRDETVNHISEGDKLIQTKYKSKHDWMGKVIHRESCKRLKFHHTTRWYIYKPQPALENATHKNPFEIQTDHLIPRRPDLVWSFLLGPIYFHTSTDRFSIRMKKNAKQYNYTNIDF